jgi:4-amino-4-deoxy-L-arabinose transferase-like glycosyltransferase
VEDERLQDGQGGYELDLALVAIIAAAVWCVHFARNFAGLWAPDAMEYADVARNIATGNGITTHSIWTMLLAKYHQLPFPSLLRPPLYPLLTSLLFRVTGPTETAAVFLCGLAYVATVIPLFILVMRSFGRTAAWLAAMLYIFHNYTLYYSISGLTEPLATLFFMIFLCVFFLREGALSVFIAGVMLGLEHATSDKALPCFVVALAFALTRGGAKRRWLAPALLALGFALVLAPFILYNLIHFGVLPYNKADPNVALMLGPSLTAGNLRSVHPMSAWTFATTYPGMLLNKFLNFFQGFTHVALFGPDSVVSPYIMVFALLGLFIKRPGGAATRCYSYVLISLLVQIFALSFLYYVESRYLMSFAPALIGFAAGWFVWQLGQISVRPALRYGVAVLLVWVALDPVGTLRSLMGWGEFSDQYRTAHDSAYVAQLLGRHTSPDAVVVSDVPWATAWYGRRTSILFPVTMEELAEIDANMIPVEAVLITSQMNASFRSRFTWTSDAWWRNILESKLLEFGVVMGRKEAVYKKVDEHKSASENAVLLVKRPATAADLKDAYSKHPTLPRWIAPLKSGGAAVPTNPESKP